MSVEIHTINSTLDASVRPGAAKTLEAVKADILKELERRRHDARTLELLERLTTLRGPVWPTAPARRRRSGGEGGPR